jgi:tetratricopeptide (TPR) repeat protein
MITARFAMVMLLGLQLASCAQLNKVPPQELDKKTSERVTQLRKDMLLSRARALVKYEPIYQELETLLPKDHGATDDIQHYKSERNEVAGHLLDCGVQSMTEKNYVQAEECLELSNQLVAGAEKQAMLDKARSIRKQQDDKRRSEQIMLAYQQAYTAGNLADAQAQLNALLALTPDHVQALALRDQLKSEIKLKMEKNLDEARNLYSQGKITEALAICNSLMLVDPKNEELLAMISRAGKVNKNIEKLSKTKK